MLNKLVFHAFDQGAPLMTPLRAMEGSRSREGGLGVGLGHFHGLLWLHEVFKTKWPSTEHFTACGPHQ